MIVQFDRRFLSAKIILTGIARDNQAVSFECIDDMIPDLIDKIIALIVIQTIYIQQKLSIITEFN